MSRSSVARIAPPVLRRLIPVIIGYGLVLAAVPLQMALWPETVAESVRQQEPDLDPYWQAMSVRLAVIQAAVIHLVSLVLAVWFTAKLLRGRQWARIALTLQMLISVPESLFSAGSGATFVPHVIASNCCHLAILALLWVPPSVRAFFGRPAGMKKRIAVVGAVVVRGGTVLAAQRGPQMSLPGTWEFPGGKIEPGETPQQSLIREMREELLCEIEVGDQVAQTTHEYDFGIVTLTTFWATLTDGDPQLTEHSAVRWLAPSELHDVEWAPADIPAVQRIHELLR